MKILECQLRGVSPYSQSRFYAKDKLQGESDDDHARRTWRNHLHVDKDGIVFIPANSLKNCLSEAAKFLSISVPGKGSRRTRNILRRACSSQNLHRSGSKGVMFNTRPCSFRLTADAAAVNA